MTQSAGTGGQDAMPSSSTFTLALAGVALRAARQALRTLKNRLEVRSLHQLDDRALKDIGLVRSDVDAALAAPLHLDPSRHLVEITGGGRHGSGSAVSPAGMMRLRGLDADVGVAIPGHVARA